MPETGASGSVGAPSEQSEGATRQQGPSYGLSLHLSVLSLSSPLLRTERRLYFAFDDCPLVPRSQKQNQKRLLSFAVFQKTLYLSCLTHLLDLQHWLSKHLR
jgi:hypothetical protein